MLLITRGPCQFPRVHQPSRSADPALTRTAAVCPVYCRNVIHDDFEILRTGDTPAQGQQTMTMLRNLLDDDAGFIISAELVIIATVVVLGMITGLKCVQVAMIGELKDVERGDRVAQPVVLVLRLLEAVVVRMRRQGVHPRFDVRRLPGRMRRRQPLRNRRTAGSLDCASSNARTSRRLLRPRNDH